MASDQRSRARKKDGLLSRGEEIGTSEAKGDRHVLRKPDGVFFQGKEVGYVDGKGRVRRPDGLIFKGDEIAQTEEGRVRELDGLIFKGNEWGYVDDRGNVRQRDGVIFKGRIIGHVRGTNADKAFAHFVLRFDHLTERLEQLLEGERERPDDPRLLERAQKLRQKAESYDALGDYDGMFRALSDLEARVKARHDKARTTKKGLIKDAEKLSFSTEWKATHEKLGALRRDWKAAGRLPRDEDERRWAAFSSAVDTFYERRQEHFAAVEREREANLRAKTRLIERAERLSSSSDWKATGEAMKALMGEWKAIGHVPREKQEALWSRFSAARQTFFDRRTAFFDRRDKERAANRRKKEALIQRAQRLSSSSDWKATGDAMKRLMAEWKAVGPAPRDDEEQLWGAFTAARQRFYDRRSAHFDALNRERAANLRTKESLCRDAERLTSASDPYDAVNAYKALQARWKSVGPVPRDEQDALWQRFRAAGDRIFANRSREKERRQAEYERKQSEWRERQYDKLRRKTEQLSRLTDSIDHDRSLIDRWQDAIYNLRPGGRADEIEEALNAKIESVSEKITSKENKVASLEDQIRDLERKLEG